MATFFGEVQFSSTRAYDEDEDEEQFQQYEIEVALTTEENLDCTSLITSFGFLANDFLEGCSHNGNCRSIGSIQLRNVSQTERIDTGDFHPRALRPCPLFLNSKGTLLCISSEDIVPKLAVKVSRELLFLIKKSCPIVVLSSHHVSKLNTELETGADPCCSTYTIQSECSSSHPSFSPLPQPSVLDSLPAALMTESIIEDRSCAIYAAFTETTAPGDVDLVSRDFVRALSHHSFCNSIKYDRKYASRTSRSEMLDRYM